ncbi:type VI secretion system-associated FHA domain protein [Enterovibrio nigricans]|uniref:FHA domain protein n=1 Tax=Enterovibrio nigricans DSM 22720 TaxID=1121868 RepID=A0A1T4UG61_9GAMM|nr:type VI secretion system-associated FHA domain protein [Enterovibrio nigricans]PKF51068.1 hypothetical protein AT251_06540 [Enterovibrio nigricans]SKA51508.1 FHA domain protein [Enterovibrio nigricans DSM 22720]
MYNKRLVLNFTKTPEEYTGAMSVELPEDGGSIGRNPGSTVALIDHNRFISGSHCLVHVYGDLHYISDVSTNGTMLNGARILKNQPISLHDGDMLVLGRYEVSVAIETKMFAQDIAIDIVPDRETNDPLVGLGGYQAESEEVSSTIEELFMKSDGQEIEKDDPVAHLAFSMNEDDDFLIKEPNASGKEETEQPVVSCQLHDDSDSIYSNFDVPNIIPEDWLAGSLNEQSSSAHASSLNECVLPESVVPESIIHHSEPSLSNTVVPPFKDSTFTEHLSQQSRKTAYWEEVTQVIPTGSGEELRVEDVLEKPQESARHTPAVETLGDLSTSFFQGLGVERDGAMSKDPRFFLQMGSCLRLCMEKLQQDLREVESLKQSGDSVAESNNILELMLTLNEQNLLAPNELVEQLLDELDDHQVHYHQAVNDVISSELERLHPQRFAEQVKTESSFKTKRQLWRQYEAFFDEKHKDVMYSAGTTAKNKIAEHYMKNLGVKSA